LLHGVVQYYTDYAFAGSLTSSETYMLQISLRTIGGTGFGFHPELSFSRAILTIAVLRKVVRRAVLRSGFAVSRTSAGAVDVGAAASPQLSGVYSHQTGGTTAAQRKRLSRLFAPWTRANEVEP
jgi:hypothetical protein